MPKLLQLLDRQPGSDLELPVQTLFAHAIEPLRTRHGQSGVGQPPVARIVDTLHEPVPLEMIDQPGDVPRRDLELIGQLTERELALRRGLERKEGVKTALAQPVLVGPAIHELMDQSGRDPQRRHGLYRARLFFGERAAGRAHGVTEAAVIQVAGAIRRQGAVEATEALDLGELHSEPLHYVAFHDRCQTRRSQPASGGSLVDPSWFAPARK